MTEPKLSSLWTPAEAVKAPTRWSIDLWGAGSSGKTHFIVFTCPGPILLVNFDRDPSALILKSERKDIYLCNLHTAGLVLSDKEAEEKLAKFEKALKEALSPEMAGGTLAVDGGSALNNLFEQVALAELNKVLRAKDKPLVEKLPALHRGSINSRILNMLAAVSQSQVNFIITHQEREIWSDDGKPTGTYEARENTQIEYGVNISVRMFTRMQSASKTAAAHPVHFGRIVLCKDNEKAVQMVLPNPSWDVLVEFLEG